MKPRYRKLPLESLDISFPIYYEKRQWAVTEYGIECLVGHYQLNKGFLSDDDFVEHHAAMTWIDLDEFVDAYCRACKIFKVKIPIDAGQFYLDIQRFKAMRSLENAKDHSSNADSEIRVFNITQLQAYMDEIEMEMERQDGGNS